MATPAGIEPALSDVTDRCFNHLNYRAVYTPTKLEQQFFAARTNIDAMFS